MSFVSELQPSTLWSHFDTILTIPRGSKHEEKARDFVVEVARRAGLPYDVDSVGNVVVRKPGTAAETRSAPTFATPVPTTKFAS